MATTNQTSDKTRPNAATRGYAFWRDGFPLIRRATLTFILCLLTGIALVISSQYMLSKQVEITNRAQALQNSTREQYHQAENEKREILDYQSRYQQLITQRFIGPELRLNWMESIQATQQAARLQPLDYEISAQQVFLVDPAIDMVGLELRGSTMLVRMNLLHENELFRFLNGLQVNQLYDLQSCHFKRNDNSNPNQFIPLLSAECSLVWLTIGKAGGDSTEAGKDPAPPVATRP